MDLITITLKHSRSKEYCDLEVPYDILICQLAEILTAKFDWANTSTNEMNHVAQVEIPGKKAFMARPDQSLSSVEALDGTIVIITPENGGHPSTSSIQDREFEWDISE